MDVAKTWWLPFPVSRVYGAWVSSETVVAPAVRMNVEPVVGGVYELFMSEGPEPDNRGHFRVVERNHRLVYSWEWHGNGEVTEISVNFAADGDGTLVELAHRGFASESSAQMHDSGWDSYIAGLQAILRKA